MRVFLAILLVVAALSDFAQQEHNRLVAVNKQLQRALEAQVGSQTEEQVGVGYYDQYCVVKGSSVVGVYKTADEAKAAMAPFSGRTRRATFLVSRGVLNRDPHGVRDSQGNEQGSGGSWNKFWHDWGYINDMAAVARRSSACMTPLPQSASTSTAGTTQDRCTVKSTGKDINYLTCPSNYPDFSGFTKVSGDMSLYYTCCTSSTGTTQGDRCTVKSAGDRENSLTCPSTYPDFSGLSKLSGDFYMYYACCK